MDQFFTLIICHDNFLIVLPCRCLNDFFPNFATLAPTYIVGGGKCRSCCCWCWQYFTVLPRAGTGTHPSSKAQARRKARIKKNSLLTTTGLNFLKSPMKLDTQNFLKIDFLCSKLNEILFWKPQYLRPEPETQSLMKLGAQKFWARSSFSLASTASVRALIRRTRHHGEIRLLLFFFWKKFMFDFVLKIRHFYFS